MKPRLRRALVFSGQSHIMPGFVRGLVFNSSHNEMKLAILEELEHV